jgi:anti-anti-sigma factor
MTGQLLSIDADLSDGVNPLDLGYLPPFSRAETVVWLGGEHDVSTAGALRQTLATVMDTGVDIIVDLSAVDFIDASVVTVLLYASEVGRANGSSFVLRAPSRCARRVIELCGLSHMVAVTPPGAAPALTSWVEIPTVPGMSTVG